MGNKQVNMITKVFGIIGIILCLIALLTPWSSSAFTFGIFSDKYSSPFYIDFASNQSIIKDIGLNQVVTFSVVMIIIFILLIVAMIQGGICIGYFDKEPPNSYLFVSIFLITSAILYIFLISIIQDDISKYTGTAYGIGFAMTIISFIIFFILYIIQLSFYQKPEEIQKIKVEEETLNILKLRYAKGEINKEQFEQMKKDIEG